MRFKLVKKYSAKSERERERERHDLFVIQVTVRQQSIDNYITRRTPKANDNYVNKQNYQQVSSNSKI